MSEKISEASKSEIAEIAERIAEMSVEILGKVDEFGTETHSSVVSVAGSYDDALEKINKLNIELETNEETTEEQKKEILFRKWELLQGGKSNIATVKPTINARTSYLDEIEKIKLEIQSKINKEIIPKLESIQQSYNTANENKRLNSMSDDAENMSTSSGALEDEATSFLSDDSNSSLESVLAATSPDCAASG